METTMREDMVRVVDHETYSGYRTSGMIHHKEYRLIYPDRMPRRRSFIFKHNKEEVIPKAEAQFLVRKYGKVIEIKGMDKAKPKGDEKAQMDVEAMKRPELVSLGARLEIKNPIAMKNEVLREAIQRKLKEGNTPMTEEELKKARAET